MLVSILVDGGALKRSNRSKQACSFQSSEEFLDISIKKNVTAKNVTQGINIWPILPQKFLATSFNSSFGGSIFIHHNDLSVFSFRSK